MKKIKKWVIVTKLKEKCDKRRLKITHETRAIVPHL